MSSRMKKSEGFTLLEVLVAMVILGLSLVTIVELFQGGLQALFASGQHTQAFMHAREKLEELTLERVPDEGQKEGTFDDGFRWETLVSPYEMPQLKKEEDETTILAQDLSVFELSARVYYKRTGREQSVELHTLKLVLPEPTVSEGEVKQ